MRSHEAKDGRRIWCGTMKKPVTIPLPSFHLLWASLHSNAKETSLSHKFLLWRGVNDPFVPNTGHLYHKRRVVCNQIDEPGKSMDFEEFFSITNCWCVDLSAKCLILMISIQFLKQD